MIENIRKYTGLMAVVFVLLGAGFLFTMNNGTSSSAGSGPTILEVYGQSLDRTAYQRMGESTLQISRELGLYQYSAFLNAQDSTRFVANRIIVQKAFEDMGIYAGEDDVRKKLQTIFASKGKYDEAAYNLFVEKRLGKHGMTQKDLRAIIAESLCLNQLIEIIGGGLMPSRTATQEQLEAQTQTITLAKIVFNRDDFVEKEDPSEEEIKSYWESHQDAFKTDEKRRISYVFLSLPEETQKKDDTTKTIAKTDEEKAAEKAKQEAKAKTAIAKSEKRRLAAKALTKEITDIYQDIIDSESAKKPLDFNAIISARKHTVIKTELFTRSTLPKELTGLTLRGSSNRNRPLGEDIFSTTMSKDAYNCVSDPLPVGDHGWIVFLLDEVVEPVLLDYTAARAKARAKLVSENGTKKVKQAAIDARTAILELMKAGKDFDTAAKEKGLTPIQVGPFSPTGKPPKDEPSARKFHELASRLNPGEISKTIDESNRSVFFLVEKRELEDTEANKLQLDFMVQRAQDELKYRTYQSWLNEEFSKAEVKGLATEQE